MHSRRRGDAWYLCYEKAKADGEAKDAAEMTNDKDSNQIGSREFLEALYQLISNIRIFEVTYWVTPYIRKWVFLGTPHFRSYGFFSNFVHSTFNIRVISYPKHRIWCLPQFLYSIFEYSSDPDYRI